MNTKKKLAIIIVAAVSFVTLVCLHIHMVFMCMKADELSQLDDWTRSIPYSMLSGKLKTVISEEEFNDHSDEGKYTMYLKLEELELEKYSECDSSTDAWKTPPCDSLTINGVKYFIEYRIDFKVHFNRIEVINFVTYFSDY